MAVAAVVDVVVAHCQEVGSVAVAAARGQVVAHSVVAVHLVAEGSVAAVAVAVVAREEMREAEGTIDRPAEAQNTAVGRVVGLSCMSVMLGS